MSEQEWHIEVAVDTEVFLELHAKQGDTHIGRTVINTFGQIASIDRLFVFPDNDGAFRGMGVGSAMLEEAEDWSKTNGCTHMVSIGGPCEAQTPGESRSAGPSKRHWLGVARLQASRLLLMPPSRGFSSLWRFFLAISA